MASPQLTLEQRQKRIGTLKDRLGTIETAYKKIEDEMHGVTCDRHKQDILKGEIEVLVAGLLREQTFIQDELIKSERELVVENQKVPPLIQAKDPTPRDYHTDP